MGEVFFLTLYLDNCFPEILAQRLEKELQDKQNNIPENVYDRENLLDLNRRKHFKKLDDLLHALGSTHSFFQVDEQAQAFVTFLERYESAGFNLIAFSIMPNHVHLCVSSSGSTAQAASMAFLAESAKHLQTTFGLEPPFWYHTPNIIPVKDRLALSKMMQFIVNEPVQRELEAEVFDWKWTFVKEKYDKLLDYKHNT